MGKKQKKVAAESVAEKCNIEFVYEDGAHAGNCTHDVPCMLHSGNFMDLILISGQRKPYLSRDVSSQNCAVMKVIDASMSENRAGPCARPLPCDEHGDLGRRPDTKCGVPMVDEKGRITRTCGLELDADGKCTLHVVFQFGTSDWQKHQIIYIDATPPRPYLNPDQDPTVCSCVEYHGEPIDPDDIGRDVFNGDTCGRLIPCVHGTLGRLPLPPAEALLGAPRPVKIAEINLAQSLNIRETITEQDIAARMVALNRGLIAKPAVLWLQHRADELALPGMLYESDPAKMWILLAGNITTIARQRLGQEEVMACEFVGDARAARIYIGADNEGAVPMTGYEKAKWLASLRDRVVDGEQNEVSIAELTAEVAASGVSISSSDASNLLNAYSKLIPEIKEAWAKRRALRGEEKEEAWEPASRYATLEFLYWVCRLTPGAQEKAWSQVQAGTPWKSLKSGPAPEPKKFMGSAYKAPDAYVADIRWGNIQAIAKRDPDIAPLVKATVVAIMSGDLEPLKKLLPEKAVAKKPAKVVAKKKKAKARA